MTVIISGFTMKKLIIVQILLFFLSAALAQQDPQFSHGIIGQITFNPAYAGSVGNLNLSVIRRNQWEGFSGAPQTSVVSLDFPFKIGKQDNGLGVLVINDKLGMQKNTRFMVNYAYKKKIFSGILSFGLSMGVINESFEGEFFIPNGDNFTPPDQDPLLNKTNLDVSDVMFDAGLGLFYVDNKIRLGISASHILEPSIKLTKSSIYFYKKHFLLFGEYTYTLSNELNLIPSFNVDTDFNTSQYSFCTDLNYKNKYWIGAAYRHEDAFVILGGIKLFKGIKLRYSYDINTSEMSSHSGGSHEFMISYSWDLKIDTNKQNHKSVRFL